MTKGQLWQALLPELEPKARQWAELEVFSETPDGLTEAHIALLTWEQFGYNSCDSLDVWLTGFGYKVSEDYEYCSSAELKEELDSIARRHLASFKHAVDAAWEVIISERS